MKTGIIRLTIIAMFILAFAGTAFSQGHTHSFPEGGLSIWYPATWKLSDQKMHVLMTKDEDLSLQVELLDVPDLESAIKLSSIEIKAMFPQDPSVEVKDLDANGLTIREIDKVSEKRSAVYYIIQSSSGKLTRIFCISMPDIVSKHRSEITQIIENIKAE